MLVQYYIHIHPNTNHLRLIFFFTSFATLFLFRVCFTRSSLQKFSHQSFLLSSIQNLSECKPNVLATIIQRFPFHSRGLLLGMNFRCLKILFITDLVFLSISASLSGMLPVANKTSFKFPITLFLCTITAANDNAQVHMLVLPATNIHYLLNDIPSAEESLLLPPQLCCSSGRKDSSSSSSSNNIIIPILIYCSIYIGCSKLDNSS
jgi:hypothetical protein